MSDLAHFHAKTGKIRQHADENGEWLIAPVVAMVTGVRNGELIVAEELGKYVDAWNDSPVTVNHPHDGRSHVSARSREMLEAFGAGRLYAARFDSDRLRCDVWVNKNRLLEFGEEGTRILEALTGGKGCDVSVGYFRDVEETIGAHNGIPYRTVAHNIRPDHLAILPFAEGACNWADGCGVPRVNQKEDGMTGDKNLFDRIMAAISAVLTPSENALATARTPDYDGTETVSWGDVDKSLAAFLDGYRKHTGAEEEGTSVPDISAAARRWIASKTLLGDADAETTDDLLVFPVVNPATNRLNQGALQAVLSGRGSQADIPAAALESARAKAEALLDEFGEDEDEDIEDDVQTHVAPGFYELGLVVAAAEGLGFDQGALPDGALAVSVEEVTVPLVTGNLGANAPVMQGSLTQAARDIAMGLTVFGANITGVRRGMGGQGWDAFGVNVGDPFLAQVSERVQYWLLNFVAVDWETGGVVDGFTAERPESCATLAWLPAQAATPTWVPNGRNVTFSHVALTVNRQRVQFPLAGELRDAPLEPLQALAAVFESWGANHAPQTETGDDTMSDRRMLIEALVASGCECTREALEAMSVPELTELAEVHDVTLPQGETLLMPADAAPVANVEDVASGQEGEATTADEAAPVEAPEGAVAPDEAPAPGEPVEGEVLEGEAFFSQEAQEALTAFAALVREVGGIAALTESLRAAHRAVEDERSARIAALVSTGQFTAAELASFSNDQLALVGRVAVAPDYGARPRPAAPVARVTTTEIPMPSM